MNARNPNAYTRTRSRCGAGSAWLSIVQRKALTPNDLGSLEQLRARLLTFGEHYRQIARRFDWTFTPDDLDRVLDRIADREPPLRLAGLTTDPTDASTREGDPVATVPPFGPYRATIRDSRFRTRGLTIRTYGRVY